MTDTERIENLRREAAAEGYVLMRAKSRARLIERTRVAEALRDCAEENAEHTRRWAQESLLAEERRLTARCAFLYGAAIAAGASADDLRGPRDE